MKKLFCAVLALMLSVSALADTKPQWEGAEGSIAETGSSTEADAAAAPTAEPASQGYDGRYVTLDSVSLQLWLPVDMQEVTLKDKYKENGCIAYYVKEDDMTRCMAVHYVYMKGMSLETYAEKLPDYGATNVTLTNINDLAACMYYHDDGSVLCVALMTGRGYCIEFSFSPMGDEDYKQQVSIIAQSIQAE